MSSLTFHPASELFPLLEGEELAALVKDIRAHGLQVKIELLDGQILDGRNRYRACLEAGVEVQTVELPSDTDAPGRVWSLNHCRRHLTLAQRADVGRKYRDMLLGKTERVRNRTCSQSNMTAAAARSRAAKVIGVGNASIGTLDAIANRDGEVHRLTVAGTLSMKQAKLLAKAISDVNMPATVNDMNDAARAAWAAEVSIHLGVDDDLVIKRVRVGHMNLCYARAIHEKDQDVLARMKAEEYTSVVAAREDAGTVVLPDREPRPKLPEVVAGDQGSLLKALKGGWLQATRKTQGQFMDWLKNRHVVDSYDTRGRKG